MMTLILSHDKLAKFFNKLLSLLISIPFAWGILCGIMDVAQLDMQPIMALLYVSIFMCMCYMIFYNKYAFIVTASILITTLLLISYSIYMDSRMMEYFNRVTNFIYRLFMYLGGYAAYMPRYELFISIVLCGIVSVLTYLLLSLRNGFYWHFIE